ncbi:Protein grpE [Desulfamplus magnetovallimortis]|uniref:Protein GrpE n=1 Tax=Desulfamplus magnetovallimortis TaxID=1246637 RepID=A0A1W1HBB3_9BACT|nr:nucleotide exchange factor GrpE [Desulfamplus magnetovallimortis]SLM29726.1 Protein grpE [Desulfamplus magnetovallimortis]
MAANEQSIKDKQSEETLAEKKEETPAGNSDACQENETIAESGTEQSLSDECASLSEEEIPSPIHSTEELTAALNAEKDRVLRISAEFENYKKRSAREMADFRKFANETLIKKLLTVVDNLERAIASATADDQNADKSSIVEGVEMTHRDILKLLESFSVKPLEAQGKQFDPAFHQAITQQESDEYPDNTVITEFQKGYLLHDRLIRPSMVVVSKATSKNE